MALDDNRPVFGVNDRAGACVAIIFVAAMGCASQRIRTSGPRAVADDRDLWNLVPAGVQGIAEIDLATLRTSPWGEPLFRSVLAGDSEERRRRFGYDVFADAERLLLVGDEISTSGMGTVIVARGRFDPARIAAAFAGTRANTTVARWRGSPMWEEEASGRAVALVTERTLVQGDAAAVRAAIDAAWGIVPDANSGPQGDLRRALTADRATPVAVIVLPKSARSIGIIRLPPSIRQLALRFEVGADIDLDAVVVLGGPPAAREDRLRLKTRISAEQWGGDIPRLLLSLLQNVAEAARPPAIGL